MTSDSGSGSAVKKQSVHNIGESKYQHLLMMSVGLKPTKGIRMFIKKPVGFYILQVFLRSEGSGSSEVLKMNSSI